MDIGGVFLHRLRQQRVDEPDDGRFVVAFEQIRGLWNVLGQVGEIGVVVQSFQHLHGGARAGLVGNSQHRVERFDGYALELQGYADEAAHLGECLRCDAGAAHGVGKLGRHAAHQYPVALGEGKRQLAGR